MKKSHIITLISSTFLASPSFASSFFDSNSDPILNFGDGFGLDPFSDFGDRPRIDPIPGVGDESDLDPFSRFGNELSWDPLSDFGDRPRIDPFPGVGDGSDLDPFSRFGNELDVNSAQPESPNSLSPAQYLKLSADQNSTSVPGPNLSSPVQYLKLSADQNSASVPQAPAARSKLRKWTQEENALLEQLVAKFRKNWEEIAKFFPERTAVSCKVHWYELRAKARREASGANSTDFVNANERRKWTQEENNSLGQLVKKLGRDWNKIAKSFPGCTAVSCQSHWYDLPAKARREASETNPPADPNATDETDQNSASVPPASDIPDTPRKWTSRENALLRQLVKKLGRDWNKIAKSFTGRTAKSCEVHWYKLPAKARRKASGANSADLVKANERHKWTPEENALLGN